MSNIGPFQVLGAVIAGNVITVIWLFVLWRVGRREALGKDPSLFQSLVAAAPPMLVAYGFWLMR
jgi:hypothetical protein